MKPDAIYLKKIPWWKRLFKPKKVVIAFPQKMGKTTAYNKWMIMHSNEQFKYKV